MDRDYPGPCSGCCTPPNLCLELPSSITFSVSGLTLCMINGCTSGSANGSFTCTNSGPGTAWTYAGGGTAITCTFVQYSLSASITCTQTITGADLSISLDALLVGGTGGFVMASCIIPITTSSGSASCTGHVAFCSSGAPAEGVFSLTVVW